MKKVKSVAFNISDPMEYKLYQYAKQNSKYFSTYVKRLIQRDMESGHKIEDGNLMEGYEYYKEESDQ